MSDHCSSDVLVRNVAIATDFSPASDRATRHALLVARQFGAAIHFFHAIRRSEFPFVPDMMIELDALAQRDCDALIARLQAENELDNINARCWNVGGEISEVFGDLIRDHCIDLLVLGTRGRNAISRLLFGSIAQEICRQVSCPVLTVGPWSRGARRQLVLKRVLFASDLSDESKAGIPYALKVARTWSAEIDLLHVCSSWNSDCRDRMEKFGRGIEDAAKPQGSPPIRYHMISGNPSYAVLDFARQNREDLIVLGLAPYRSLYRGPLLSHAYEIVCQATCPVLNVCSNILPRPSTERVFRGE